MFRLFQFEFTKMLRSKKNIIVFIIFFAYSILTQGIMDYFVIENQYSDPNSYMSGRSGYYIYDPEVSEEVTDYMNRGDYNSFLKFEIKYLQKNHYESYQNIIAIDEYCLDNHIVPQFQYGSCCGLFIITSFGNSLSSVMIIFLFLIISDIFNKEHQSGTIKLLMTQPLKRSQIIIAKYFAGVSYLLIMSVVGIVPNFIFQRVTTGFNDINYPVELMNNFLSPWFVTSFNSRFLVPLWFYEILAAILIILAVFCFAAIAMFFSIIIKNKGLSLGVLSIFALLMVTLTFKFSYLPVSSLNPFSLTFFDNDLLSILPHNDNPQPVTFMDTVLCFSTFSIIFIKSSITAVKRREIV